MSESVPVSSIDSESGRGEEFKLVVRKEEECFESDIEEVEEVEEVVGEVVNVPAAVDCEQCRTGLNDPSHFQQQCETQNIHSRPLPLPNLSDLPNSAHQSGSSSSFQYPSNSQHPPLYPSLPASDFFQQPPAPKPLRIAARTFLRFASLRNQI
jgi:hypothetical protein